MFMLFHELSDHTQCAAPKRTQPTNPARRHGGLYKRPFPKKSDIFTTPSFPRNSATTFPCCVVTLFVLFFRRLR